MVTQYLEGWDLSPVWSGGREAGQCSHKTEQVEGGRAMSLMLASFRRARQGLERVTT